MCGRTMSNRREHKRWDDTGALVALAYSVGVQFGLSFLLFEKSLLCHTQCDYLGVDFLPRKPKPGVFFCTARLCKILVLSKGTKQ